MQFLPDDIGADSRVSPVFQPRSFRRYQTLGCIDLPERVGKRAMYGFRHFVQALLVRKLLWDHLPADRIAALMAGRSTEETKRMLFEGVEMGARRGGGAVVEESGAGEVEETRTRVRVRELAWWSSRRAARGAVREGEEGAKHRIEE